MSLYEEVGGEETFRTFVAHFYALMREDDLIGPMYPQDDWEGSEDRLRWFLEQYWGGPKTYGEQRGHPRLRMRHMPFAIGEKEAQRWLDLMSQALDQVELTEEQRAAIWDHMQRAAAMMINQE
ncbi:globin [Corynebacterium sp. 35RC1]|nr:globin [Corynebacterium sp. 35RC1]